ncbi:MAG: TldD/PmbA family protein [FCB group bacterium]|nr:TldD/PmbA family protein [FCB group bacterium]
MIGEKKLIARLEKVLAQSKADETEIVFMGEESGLTRFANSAIHQNVHENSTKIYFRSVLGKKVGIASTTSLTASDLKQTLDASCAIASRLPENPNFPGLPKPAKYKNFDTFDQRTAKFSPRDRAKAVKKLVAVSDRKNFTMAGAFSTGSSEIAIVNSKGVRAYQPLTSASINMIAMSDTSSGYAAGLSRHVDEIDVVKLADIAVGKCDLSQNPLSIEPGNYEVILEPAAVASLLEWMNYIGLGAKSFQDKTSFLSGKIGRKVTSDKISIFDDAHDTKSMAFPFDLEGVPKKKIQFINKGIAKGVAYNSQLALKDKVKSTGHALSPDEAALGAMALNMVVGPGTVRRGKMIENVKKGILITRFHYINGFIDTPNAVLTGMTRDGTFLIEKGEIVGGLKNLRFTDAMLRSFGTAVALSKEQELVESWGGSIGCVKAPAMHLKRLKFTGKTEF